MIFRILLIALFFLSEWATSEINCYAQTIQIAAVTDLKRVFEDGFNLPYASDTLYVFGIRGEVLSGQCFIKSKKTLTGLTVDVSNLKNLTTGYSIPAENVRWNFVGSIPLSENAPNQLDHVLVRKAPARFPDYLMEERELDVEKGMCQAIWLTVEIPEKADAGLYTGLLNVKSSAGEHSLPVILDIFPLTLSEERHLKVTEWYNTRHFERFHGIKEKYSEAWFNMLRVYAENLVEHRQNIFQVPMNSIEISLNEDGILDFDFSRFDQIAQVFWDTGKMDYLETGELARFGEEAWFSTDIHFKDFTVLDKVSSEKIIKPGMEVIPHLLPAFESHLRANGWLDKTLFHVKDEPTVRNVTAWKEISSIIHKYAPDLVRIDALETTHLFDNIEIAVPKLDYLAGWHKTYEEAARNGTEHWFYTVGIYQARSYPNKTIDMPLIDNRILHWINYRYDLSGFLHWGWNQWTEDPFGAVGMHIGDGWHVYPSKNGVLNSLRWEQMRNGIQDYEYFWLLENKIQDLKDSLGTRFDWIDPKQRGKEIAGHVVKDFLHISRNPEVLYAAKEKVVKELLEFDASPIVYVQSNPPVNSSIVKERSYLLEIFGWAESGTKIMINQEEVDVDNNGLFLWNLKLTEENNQVVIKARKDQSEKTIIREFEVKK
jgi:hypothetical protein